MFAQNLSSVRSGTFLFSTKPPNEKPKNRRHSKPPPVGEDGDIFPLKKNAPKRPRACPVRAII
ncbi:MAG: hypothetical protein D6714_05485 [Bacteroidetes bacterium]|nr:MAG: hypothetical protein D6714_05485 [Bacteroidota bacterium]